MCHIKLLHHPDAAFGEDVPYKAIEVPFLQLLPAVPSVRRQFMNVKSLSWLVYSLVLVVHVVLNISLVVCKCCEMCLFSSVC